VPAKPVKKENVKPQNKEKQLERELEALEGLLDNESSESDNEVPVTMTARKKKETERVLSEIDDLLDL
jgi:hypothetical protein